MSSIIQIAFRHKPRELVSLVKRRGDSSFCSPLDTRDERIFALLPNVKSFGYDLSHNSGVMLAGMVYVEPHEDMPVGDLVTSKAIFGLLSGGKNFKLFVRNGEDWDFRDMVPGAWVLFEDHKEHMVMSDTPWCGVAIQVKEIDAGDVK